MLRYLKLALGLVFATVLGLPGIGMICFGIGCGWPEPAHILMHLFMRGVPGVLIIGTAVLVCRSTLRSFRGQHEDD